METQTQTETQTENRKTFLEASSNELELIINAVTAYEPANPKTSSIYATLIGLLGDNFMDAEQKNQKMEKLRDDFLKAEKELKATKYHLLSRLIRFRDGQA